jgi:hypothetical protein
MPGLVGCYTSFRFPDTRHCGIFQKEQQAAFYLQSAWKTATHRPFGSPLARKQSRELSRTGGFSCSCFGLRTGFFLKTHLT